MKDHMKKTERERERERERKEKKGSSISGWFKQAGERERERLVQVQGEEKGLKNSLTVLMSLGAILFLPLCA